MGYCLLLEIRFIYHKINDRAAYKKNNEKPETEGNQGHIVPETELARES